MKKTIFKSNSAVSSVIGIILILGLTILSISILLISSVPLINDLKDLAESQKIEQGFTVLDSRISKIAIGESPLQTTSFAMIDGMININDDYNKSKIQIITKDINDSIVNSYNLSLGTIQYSNDNRIIAYEGGGIWSKYPSGRTVLVSPPEFHYNGETLTLPVITIHGNSQISGTSKVAITTQSSNIPIIIHPNINNINPLQTDKILIYITSQFYDGWVDFANNQPYMSATTDSLNQTAIIQLYTIPKMGTFPLSSQFKVGVLNQTDDNPITNFTFTLNPSGTSGLSPLNVDITASSGTKTLTYLFKQSSDNIFVTILYKDSLYGSEEWKTITPFKIIGSQENEYTSIDLLNSSIITEYQDDINDTFSFSTTPDSVVPLSTLTQHYMKLMTSDNPVVFNIKEQQNKGKLNYQESTLTINYNTNPNTLTYLHISQNNLFTTIN